MKQEIYTCSATKEEIPLSFTGRCLLFNLRDATVSAIASGNYNANWRALSIARRNLAQYMSELEVKQLPLSQVSYLELLQELERRLSK